jgi:hypothetical protein
MLEDGQRFFDWAVDELEGLSLRSRELTFIGRMTIAVRRETQRLGER